MSATTDEATSPKGAANEKVPVFRTPEEVAPVLGMSKTELRRYCRESGHCTRLSKNRIVLDQHNITDLVAWVKARNVKPATTPNGDIDHFA